MKIADALDVSLDELFGRKPPPRRPAAAPAARACAGVRRLERLEDLPRDDQATVLKMIEAMADRSGRRRAADSRSPVVSGLRAPSRRASPGRTDAGVLARVGARCLVPCAARSSGAGSTGAGLYITPVM